MYLCWLVVGSTMACNELMWDQPAQVLMGNVPFFWHGQRVFKAMRGINSEGLDIITEFKGWRGLSLLDVASIWTIGFRPCFDLQGVHTSPGYPDITEEEEEFLKREGCRQYLCRNRMLT